MKELSIEEKARRYDELLVKLQKAKVDNNVCDDRYCCVIDDIVPELKESEDERIRKALIRYFTLSDEHAYNEACGVSYKDILAWLEEQGDANKEYWRGYREGKQEILDKYAELEKQGEPTEINPSEFDLRLNRLLKQFDSLPKEELASSLSFYLNVVQNNGSYKEEKQGDKNILIKEPITKQKGLDYPYVTGWRKNYKDNKPSVKHSILMFTTHGVAEGEWLGEEWCQYRWSCKIKDEDVLYWLHLSDLENLEKEGEQKPANKIEPKNYSSIDPHFFKTTDNVEPKFHEGE